ncbi:MAG: dihydroneopterin aldolase [Fibrobacter sp.]|nr:dihydroneopterin aldolase [Fibrobacter sp.]
MVVETGKISLKDIQFNCILGTLPFEREQEQPVVLNVSVWLDFSLAARNDDLVHSIDYAQLAENLKGFIRNAKFQLEETLVLETAKYILGNYPKAQMAEVSIRKPMAIPDCAGAESTIRVRR